MDAGSTEVMHVAGTRGVLGYRYPFRGRPVLVHPASLPTDPPIPPHPAPPRPTLGINPQPSALPLYHHTTTIIGRVVTSDPTRDSLYQFSWKKRQREPSEIRGRSHATRHVCAITAVFIKCHLPLFQKKQQIQSEGA